VRLILVRGQWRVDISRSGPWFSPTVWQAYLDGTVGDLTSPSLEDECQMVVDRIDEIQQASERDLALGDRLLGWQAKRAQMRGAAD
jgi:hypothetical protein